MDRGEMLKREFTVTPGQNGTFVVRERSHYSGPRETIPIVWGFTSFDDLLRWLAEEGAALKDNGPQPPS